MIYVLHIIIGIFHIILLAKILLSQVLTVLVELCGADSNDAADASAEGCGDSSNDFGITPLEEIVQDNVERCESRNDYHDDPLEDVVYFIWELHCITPFMRVLCC